MFFNLNITPNITFGRKNKTLRNLEKNEHFSNNVTSITDPICEKSVDRGGLDLIDQMDQDDLSRMAEGSFDIKKQLFVFNDKGKEIKSHKNPYKNPIEPLVSDNYLNKTLYKIKFYSIPKKAKRITILFEIKDRLLRDVCTFYIKNGNGKIPVDSHSNIIETNLNLSVINKFIEFSFDYNDINSSLKLTRESLSIYIKSFSMS